MTEINVSSGTRTVQVYTVAPVDQTSANAETVLAGSELDARPWRSLSYTIHVITHDIDWVVYGANASDYSDAVVVQASATVVIGASSSYATTQAVYAYYRVTITSHVGGAHGVATVAGICKG